MAKVWILYHASCADGFGAAYAAWLRFKGEAQYVPMHYGQPAPKTGPDDLVYLLDFSLPREELVALITRTPCTEVHDHHKTAMAALEGLPNVTFDMDKSGAVLAWERFHPGVPVPAILRYVQDRDLWRFALLESKEINAAIASYPHSFDVWDDLAARMATPASRDGVVWEGRALRRHIEQKVKSLAGKAEQGMIAGYRVPVVNATDNISEVCEAMCYAYPDAPFAASYFDRADKGGGRVRQWSLRSRNGFDVSAVARLFGGGGHAAAAGFSTGAPAIHLTANHGSDPDA